MGPSLAITNSDIQYWSHVAMAAGAVLVVIGVAIGLWKKLKDKNKANKPPQ